MSKERGAYPSDVSDDEWVFCAPYLTLMREDAQQREYPLRELSNGVRYVVRTGCQWRHLPHNFPSWSAVYQQGRRWWAAKCFETMAHDLREMLRVVGASARSHGDDHGQSHDAIHPQERCPRRLRRRQTPQGLQSAYRVDTLGHLLALRVAPADEQDRAQVAALAQATQDATGENVQLAYVDQGYTGEAAAAAAQQHAMRLEVVKLPHAKRGFVLLPRRRVVERSFGWLSRCRRLARDHERLAHSLEAMHWLALLVPAPRCRLQDPSHINA